MRCLESGRKVFPKDARQPCEAPRNASYEMSLTGESRDTLTVLHGQQRPGHKDHKERINTRLYFWTSFIRRTTAVVHQSLGSLPMVFAFPLPRHALSAVHAITAIQ